jgi:hypothetical protein
MHPYEYQGLMIPYDPHPIVIRDMAYIVGVDESGYKLLERTFPREGIAYNIDLQVEMLLPPDITFFSDSTVLFGRLVHTCD